MRILFEFENKPLLFKYPHRMICCDHPDKLTACFNDIEQALAQGYHVAGFLSYEAGYAFEPVSHHLHADGFPLLFMGVYDAPRRERILAPQASFHVEDLSSNISRAAYTQDIARIHDHIRDGDVYQVTYCLKKFFSFQGSAYDLYCMLLKRQPVPYPVFIDGEDFKILSLSPEMFVQKAGARIVTKPMKGSLPRGGWHDVCGEWWLHRDKKNRAENVMIADLLRNDLGRIGRGVRVSRLFEVARYKTIFQMTSTVCAKVPEDVLFYDLFRAIFPSGSVTGAPKVEAMRIIHALEKEPRRIYTGAIGWITPQRDLFFNVPIRTVLLRGGRGEMGVGGGIVWDSTADGEWAEGRWKTRFLEEVVRASC